MLARSLLFVVWLYGGMTVCGVLGAPFAAFSEKAATTTARIWTRVTLWGARALCGIRVEIVGLEKIPEGACLMAMKHHSMLDTLLPFLLLEKPSIVLKRELLSMPIFGWYTQRVGCIAIDRGAHASALKGLLRAARDVAARGRSIVIFPEGTRQAVGAPPDYKPGVAALYRDLAAPCVPVALDTGRCWPAHGVMRRPGRVTIQILDPIAPGLSRGDFMAELETRIETATARLIAAPNA
ncbi:MAG: lysophospholipid acyltransferase family protein [Hyphomonadaceae bacterium]|nr:lysophospholipid acyltransferase family protein [Hyphomonadaceae bacterium]